MKIRGNLDEFLHSGAVIMIVVWAGVAGIIFLMNPKIAEQRQIQLYLLGGFSGLILLVSSLILIQTISVDEQYIRYSSNFFPLFKRKIPIASIGSIGFGVDVTLLNEGMAAADVPAVGMRIVDTEGRTLGGFNTKVYHHKDLERVIQRIVAINPAIKVDGV